MEIVRVGDVADAPGSIGEGFKRALAAQYRRFCAERGMPLSELSIRAGVPASERAAASRRRQKRGKAKG